MKLINLLSVTLIVIGIVNIIVMLILLKDSKACDFSCQLNQEAIQRQEMQQRQEIIRAIGDSYE